MPLHPISPKLLRIHTDKWEFETDAPARRFSYKEAARLQGFMPQYTTHGGDLIFPDTINSGKNITYNMLRHKFRVIGNAVPPPMFEAVAKALPDIWG